MAAADVEMAVSAPEQPSTSSQEEEDLYTKLKALQRTLEFLDIQVCHTVACACLGWPVLRRRAPSVAPSLPWLLQQADRQCPDAPHQCPRPRAGGVHQGGAAQPEEGAAAGGGGGEANTVRAPLHRPVPRDGGRQLWRRQLDHRCVSAAGAVRPPRGVTCAGTRMSHLSAHDPLCVPLAIIRCDLSPVRLLASMSGATRTASSRPRPSQCPCPARSTRPHPARMRRRQLLRPHPLHSQPRAPQAQLLRRAAPPLQRARRHPAPRGRLLHRHALRPGAPRRDVPRHWRQRRPEAGDPRGG